MKPSKKNKKIAADVEDFAANAKRLYTIRDLKANICNAPCIVDNDDVARRMFGDLVHDTKDTLISKHPDDFALWFIGWFNPANGELVQTAEGVHLICLGSDFVKNEE